MNEAFTTHFQSQTISSTVDNLSTEIVVSELVRQNQTLLTLSKDVNIPFIRLLAGRNCFLSDDGLSIIAETAGYPVLNKSTKANKTIITIDITPVIDVAENRMLATLSLYPHIDGTPKVTLKDILTICEEHDVNCCIDELIIEETIEQANQLQQPQLEIPIARGLLPVNGIDAFLRFEVEIGPLPGKILQDGSIDWRERKMFVGIDKDELIATKIPLTHGTPGTNINSLSIQQKPGKDIKVKVAGDVIFNEESRQITATCSGVLSIVNGSDVKVSAKQTIDGDVDLSVGNIESNDGLEIKGDVKPGFTVRCKGDLSIGGNIQNATVHAKANSRVESGLLGENANLITDGDVEISFAERGHIVSGGNVIISKGAYYADVTSKKSILCHPDSKIVGGTFCSSQDLICGNVGSDNAVPAILVAGVDPARFQQRNTLRLSIQDQKLELEKLMQINGQEYTETALYKKKEAALQKRITSFKKLNLIPDSPLYSGYDPTVNYSSATIAVKGQIFSGSKIRIGNISTTLTEDALSIRFYINRTTEHIVAVPYI